MEASEFIQTVDQYIHNKGVYYWTHTVSNGQEVIYVHRTEPKEFEQYLGKTQADWMSDFIWIAGSVVKDRFNIFMPEAAKSMMNEIKAASNIGTAPIPNAEQYIVKDVAFEPGTVLDLNAILTMPEIFCGPDGVAYFLDANGNKIFLGNTDGTPLRIDTDLEVKADGAPSAAKHKCRCPFDEIMRVGCKCGGE